MSINFVYISFQFTVFLLIPLFSHSFNFFSISLIFWFFFFICLFSSVMVLFSFSFVEFTLKSTLILFWIVLISCIFSVVFLCASDNCFSSIDIFYFVFLNSSYTLVSSSLVLLILLSFFSPSIFSCLTLVMLFLITLWSLWYCSSFSKHLNLFVRFVFPCGTSSRFAVRASYSLSKQSNVKVFGVSSRFEHLNFLLYLLTYMCVSGMTIAYCICNKTNRHNQSNGSYILYQAYHNV